MIIIGIDPGQSGGLAAASESAGFEVRPMPVIAKPKGGGHMLDLPVIVALLEEWKRIGRTMTIPSFTYERVHVFLEQAQAMPGQGVSSMFSYGRGFGQIEGILAALPLRYTLVHPRTWCKVMHRDTPTGQAKARSLIVAKRLFPDVKLTVGRSTKPHEGLVDALLIAEYGRRLLNQSQGGY